MAMLPRNRPTRWFRLWLTLGIALSFQGTAVSQSVLLQLRNGDRVSGNLVAEEGGQITVSNAIFGRIVVPIAQIERRTTNGVAVANASATPTNAPGAGATALGPAAQRRLNELQAVYLANQISTAEYHKQRAQLLAEATAPVIVIRPAETKPNGVPAPALINPAVTAKPPAGAPPPNKPAVPKHWSGEALLGADLGFSQKDRQLYTGRLKFIYAKIPLRSSFDYLGTYGMTDGDLSANRMDSSLKTDYDLNRRTYVYTLLGGGYDQIRKIDWRYEVGPGVGRHLLKLTNLVLNAEVGGNYQEQNFEGNRQDELFLYRLGQDFRWNMGTQFTFDEKIEYLPQWNDFEEYKLRFEANIRYWMRANLSLNLTVINTFDTVTAKGVDQNDLQVRSSIGVKF